LLIRIFVREKLPEFIHATEKYTLFQKKTYKKTATLERSITNKQTKSANLLSFKKTIMPAASPGETFAEI